MLYRARPERGLRFELESCVYGLRRAARRRAGPLLLAAAWMVSITALAAWSSPELFHGAGPSPLPSAAPAASAASAAAAGEAAAGSPRERVLEAARFAWGEYEARAWGADEVRPVTGGRRGSWGDFGVTVCDALPTLLLLGLDTAGAVRHVAGIDWAQNYEASFFETTIRHLGSLVSAADMLPAAGPERGTVLRKARELADRLMPAFAAGTGIARSKVNLLTGAASNHAWAAGGSSVLAETGSNALELGALSRLTGEPRYAAAARRVLRQLEAQPKPLHRGLYPVYVNPETLAMSGPVTLGSMSDSFYEYTLKLYLLTSRSGEPDLDALRMYNECVEGLREHLLARRTDARTGRALTFVVSHDGTRQVPVHDHLAAFVPGLLALGAAQGRALAALAPHLPRDDPRRALAERAESDLALAEELAATGHALYEAQPTGLAPESVRLTADGYEVTDARYLLRPEHVESLFYLWRVTHKPQYREWGAAVLGSLEKHCRVAHGFSSIADVRRVPAEAADSTQSFFFSETIKYLYLLFSDDTVLPLDDWVLTTEGHPLRIVADDDE